MSSTTAPRSVYILAKIPYREIRLIKELLNGEHRRILKIFEATTIPVEEPAPAEAVPVPVPAPVANGPAEPTPRKTPLRTLNELKGLPLAIYEIVKAHGTPLPLSAVVRGLEKKGPYKGSSASSTLSVLVRSGYIEYAEGNKYRVTSKQLPLPLQD